MGRAVVRAGVDTWVDPARPNANNANTVNLQVGGSHNGNPAYGYLYFQNPAPAQATITSAVLRVNGRGDWGPAARTMRVQRINRSIKFAQVTWNTRPGVTGGEVVVSQANRNDNTVWEFDIQPQIQTITNGAANYGFRISCDDVNARQRVFSLNAQRNRPTLEVAWADRPNPPTQLVPSGNQIVSVQRPTLGFDFTDVSGNTDLAAVHVQISPTANWDNPAWNSGAVPSDEPEFNLATTASIIAGQGIWAGLNDGQSTFWRVRVQDGAGLWSLWSSQRNGVGAQFRRVTKGSLSLLAPAPDPNNYVEDVTPPIIWQMTGRNQQSWRVIIARPEDPSDWLYNSGRTNGTANAWTLPRGILTDWGSTYRVMVDTWDTFTDRIGTPGDVVFYRVSRNFRLQGDPTVDPVVNLRGVFDPTGRPYLTLSWQRDTAPDGFNILRNNRVIESGIEPQDVMVDPTNYRYIDKDAPQNVRHVWVVQAIRNGVASRDNPQWAGQIRNVHAWLVDWETDRLVGILDPEISFEMPDNAATYEPIQRDRVVRVVQRQRGMQGTVSGNLTTFAGTSVAQWETNLLWMKARPVRVYALMVGNKTWRVQIGDVTVAPTRIPNNEVTAISFSFWSLDGPPRP